MDLPQQGLLANEKQWLHRYLQELSRPKKHRMPLFLVLALKDPVLGTFCGIVMLKCEYHNCPLSISDAPKRPNVSWEWPQLKKLYRNMAILIFSGIDAQK